MKKTPMVAVAAIALMAVALSGCGSTPSSSSSNSNSKFSGELKKIADSGEITVVTTNAIPFSYVTASDKNVQGVARDILDGFLKSEGLSNIKVNTMVLPFDDSMPAIQAGKADMILDAFYIKPDRQKIVDFTSPVINDPEAIVVKKGNPDGITDLMSLCGKKVGVNTGTAYADLLTSTNDKCPSSSKIDIQQYKTFQPAITDVALGRTAAMLIDAAIPSYALSKNPNAGFEFVKDYQPTLPAAQGFIFKKGVSGILPEFDAYLKKIQTDGTEKSILEKYKMLPVSAFLPTPSS
jgi:polar amino acid transport system substrate-binding protein